MKHSLSEILEDNSGGLSASRFQMLMWNGGGFLIWAYVCVKTGTLVPIPETVLLLLLGITSAKVVQRFGEKAEIQAEKTKEE